MSNFRALVLHEEGGKVVPRLETVDEARLPAGEVTVAVEYSTLNYKDGMILEGQGRLVRNTRMCRGSISPAPSSAPIRPSSGPAIRSS